jgi:hypothetical protein
MITKLHHESSAEMANTVLCLRAMIITAINLIKRFSPIGYIQATNWYYNVGLSESNYNVLMATFIGTWTTTHSTITFALF